MAIVTVTLTSTYDDIKPYDFGDRWFDAINDLVEYKIDFTETTFVDGALVIADTRANYEERFAQMAAEEANLRVVK